MACISAYPFIEIVASLFTIDLPRNQSGAIGLPNKPIALNFSVTRPKNRTAICWFMRIYAKLCVRPWLSLQFWNGRGNHWQKLWAIGFI